MKIRIYYYSILTLTFTAALLVSCGRHSTISEKTSFTHIDSLTDTYLTLQDTLLHSWNVLLKEEHEKMQAMEKVMEHLLHSPTAVPSQVAALGARLDQLHQLNITTKTLANQYVVEEHDVAAQAVTHDLLTMAESNSALLMNKEFTQLVARIKSADQRTWQHRSGYDSIVHLFNNFLEKNKNLLTDIEKSGSLEKRPTFNEATIK